MSVNIVGNIILNQFRVESFIASGGMGVVYKAWDLQRNVYLAMKVLHEDLADDPSMFKRFQREARALQKLAHPNIVPFYGLHKSGDLIFLLERYIDGLSLAQILKKNRGRPLTIQETLTYLQAMCSALGYAHANSVVHCDVKPANVMVDQGGNIYLTDFGIARHAESTTTTLATAGAPAYMAPEQIRGTLVNPATDVYALGVTLFEMLTGRRPFRGSDTSTDRSGTTANERIIYAHLNLAPPDPRSLNPDISSDLAAVILRALSKEPKARYTDAQAFFTAVLAACRLSPEQIPQRVSLPEGFGYEDGQELPHPGGEPFPPPRLPTWLWVVGGGIILLLLGGFLFFSQPRGFAIALFPTATNTLTPTIAPTQTPVPSPTPSITPSPYPSATPTLTPTPSPTPTPAFEWLTDYLQKGNQAMGYFTSMVIDSQGVIHLVFFQDNYDIVWYADNHTGKWQYKKVIGNIGGGLHLSLALDSKGNPYIAYNTQRVKKQGNTPRLILLQWTGSAWRGPFQDINHEVANTDISMALGPDDSAHFSFLDDYSSQVIYAHFSKDRYVDQALGQANPNCQSFPIAVDQNGEPHLVYQAADGLTYATQKDGTWLMEKVDARPGAGYYSAIALDAQGNPNVAYYVQDEKTLWYARKGKNGWETFPVDTSADVGQFPSIAVDKNGFVHISYYDATHQDLKYAYGQGNSWSVTTVDSAGNVGEWNSLALNPDGIPYISYLEKGNEDLKLAQAFPRPKSP